MRDQWAEGLGSPTELRYVDWILTVPLMVVEFALLTGKTGKRRKTIKHRKKKKNIRKG
jgi:sensory rhodopsin